MTKDLLVEGSSLCGTTVFLAKYGCLVKYSLPVGVGRRGEEAHTTYQALES